MWKKSIREMNWFDISSICPICDKEMSIDCISSECPDGHYAVYAGSYHVDYFLHGEHIATTDDIFNEEAYATLEKLIPEARAKYQGR